MTIEEDFWAELAQIQAESIGWIPLEEGAYLHIGSDDAVKTAQNGSGASRIARPSATPTFSKNTLCVSRLGFIVFCGSHQPN